eukprot:11239942-Karenia_brevis.AAC.1
MDPTTPTRNDRPSHEEATPPQPRRDDDVREQIAAERAVVIALLVRMRALMDVSQPAAPPPEQAAPESEQAAPEASDSDAASSQRTLSPGVAPDHLISKRLRTNMQEDSSQE